MSAALIPGWLCMSEERRLFPRRVVSIAVELTNCLSETVEGTIINLSEQGLLVAGDEGIARLDAMLPGIPLELSLCFRLQGELIRCDARAIYLRRRGALRYEIGLEFCWLDYFSRRLLQQVVAGIEGATD